MTNSSTSGSNSKKQQIADGFGESVKAYEEEAELQRNIADRLLASLKPWRDSIPSGPIMELGCGTGFVTKGLAELYPDREIHAIDISEEMVEFCRQKLKDYPRVKVDQGDAEQFSDEEFHPSLTVAGFVAQWLKDPAITLAKWLELTKPGGLLLASFPGNESFPEWRKYCRELGLPFTANPLPDVEEMVIKMSLGPSQVDYYEDTVTQTFESSAHFFQYLKKVGASTQLGDRSLSSRELSMLTDHWDSSTEGQVKVSYHIVFLAVKRDYNS